MRSDHWWSGGVIYQVYPRSFADSNADGVGDLQGIISRLDHLAGTERALDVDGIWLSPIYPSPMADFGYDITDYCGVDRVFGSLLDLDELIAAAHRRDLRVVLDWIPNHTSDAHPWFADSRSSRTSPKRDWYVWRPSPEGGFPPNNWKSFFPAVGSAWTWDAHTGEWYLHSFLPQQPDLNWDNPEVEEALENSLAFWIDRGIDGFRIDALPLLGKDPLLRSNPAEQAAVGPWGDYNIDWSSVHPRLRRLRDFVRRHSANCLLVGEVNLLDQARFVAYFDDGTELDLAHSFRFAQLRWQAGEVREFVADLTSRVSEVARIAWYLNNHDASRAASRFEAGPVGEQRARAAAVLLLTLPGVPFIYQGEELGLADTTLGDFHRADIEGRDPQRAPMPWDPPSEVGPEAGFTTGVGWLPPHQDAERLCVARQQADPTSTLALYRRLLQLRRSMPALREGSFELLTSGEQSLAYRRQAGDEAVVVAINFSDAVVPLDPEPLPGAATVLISSSVGRREGALDHGHPVLRPNEAIVMRAAPFGRDQSQL